MDDESGIRGRCEEIKKIRSFITSKIESKTSGILYLTGPPGTGKSMSIQYVLDQVKQVPTVSLNCLRASSSKTILSRLCRSTGLDKFINHNESEMMARLARKFTGRTCEPYVIVLDEMDQLPKSKNVDLIRTIFSWPNQANSKLILVGIANTVNLTSKYETISKLIGKDNLHITKVIFRPYTTNDIKEILNWYLENDENFEDANVEPRALNMIAAKYARDNGDIRGALNALKNCTDDTVKKQRRPLETSNYPTPPSTPCKEPTTILSVATSTKKRQRDTNYIDDVFPFPHQVILICIYKLCSKARDFTTDSLTCLHLIEEVLQKYGIRSSRPEIKSMQEILEMQGLIILKKGRPREKIVLKASETELSNLVKRKDMIMDLLNNII